MSRGNRRYVCRKKPHGSGLRLRMRGWSSCRKLQKITEDGCIAEGVYPSNCRGCNATFGCDNCPDEGYNEIDEFSEIWDSTVKKSDIDRYGWDANPWVFVYEFEHCEKPKEE